MTILTVTSTGDSGNGTLRNAIAQAQNSDTILFDPSIAGQTITLSSTLNINKGISIDGTDKNITVSGNNAVTTFTVTNPSSVTTTIANLTIANGTGTGAAGTNGVSGQSASSGGKGGNAAGGIYAVQGKLNLVNDTFTNDKATGGTGGTGGITNSDGFNFSQANGAGGDAAGGVFVEPAVTVAASNLRFVNDSATPGAGGTSSPLVTSGGPGASGQAYSNSNSDTVNNANVVCFASGTRIRTVRGEVAVEDLAVGDRVVTASGEHRPIRWIGARVVDLRDHPDPRATVPIRIARDAFGAGLPARDLFLSPGHAVAVTGREEVLIPAHLLVNGATIVPAPTDEVTYWHVELDTHDILLAEGLPAESYLDCGNRGFFDGADALPDRKPATTADSCRPFVNAGLVVETVRERLAAQARALGWTKTDDMDPHLLVDGERVDGIVAGGMARFLLPARVRDVVLVSETFSPRDAGEWDDRRLGLGLTSLQVSDGFAVDRVIPLDDPALAAGLHPAEAEGLAWRWTIGRLPLPPGLWSGCRTHAYLQIAFKPTSGTRWIEPESMDRLCPEADRANVVALKPPRAAPSRTPHLQRIAAGRAA